MSIITTKIKGIPLSELPQGTPCNRSIETINVLHEFNNLESITSFPNATDISALVRDNELFLDFGCGRGRLCREIKEKYPTIKVLGFSAHEVEKTNTVFMDRIYYGLAPENLTLLNDFQRRVSLITETYGPTSFADNPVHALLYASLLLKSDGFYTGISSTTKSELGASVFGDKETQSRIKQFFKIHLKTNLAIIPTTIKSAVQEESLFTDFIVRFHGSNHNLGAKDFIDLCALVDKEIGVPSQGNSWYDLPGEGHMSIKNKSWQF